MMLPDPREVPTLGVPEAGALLGLGRTSAYEQARRYLRTSGAVGLPVIAFGRSLRCPTALLLDLLGIRPVGRVGQAGKVEAQLDAGEMEPARPAGSALTRRHSHGVRP